MQVLMQNELSRDLAANVTAVIDMAMLVYISAQLNIVGVTTFGADVGVRQLQEWMFQLESLSHREHAIPLGAWRCRTMQEKKTNNTGVGGLH